MNDAAPFVRAVRDGPPYDRSIWSLHASLRMLDRSRPNAPDVYGDLAYMPELVSDPDLCVAFFRALLRIFGPGDPSLSRVMYGTDWIMFGLEGGSEKFLAAVETGMSAAGFSSVQRDNVLWTNANRFLSTES